MSRKAHSLSRSRHRKPLRSARSRSANPKRAEAEEHYREESQKKSAFLGVLAELHAKAIEHRDPAITKIADRIENMTKWS